MKYRDFEKKVRKVFHLRPKIRSGMVRNNSVGSVIADIAIMVIVGLMAFICIIPMWHVLMQSFSDGYTIANYDGIALVPQGGFTFRAYEELFAYRDGIIWRGYLNTIIYVAGTVGLGLLLNVLAGYCLSRETKLGKFMTILCLFSLMFSGGQAPLYWIITSIGMDKVPYLAVIFTECTMGMYLIMGGIAFRSVPKETVESAQLEGAGHFRVMFQIMLPQCMGIFMITVLMTFVMAWNSFVGAQLFYGRDEDLFPLQLVLTNLKEDVDGLMMNNPVPYERYPMQFAGVVMATLPIMIAMPFFQDQIESGVMVGAIKG